MNIRTRIETCRQRVAMALGLTMSLGLLAGCDDGTPTVTGLEPGDTEVVAAPFNAPVKDPLTIMTRNVYLGGDIALILQADLNNPFSLIAAANQVWAQVQGNDFHERAEALVDEIAAARPDIVSMQEAVQFVYTDASGQITTDFVQIMQNEIDARGLPYHFLAGQNNTSVQVPLSVFTVGGAPVIVDGQPVFTSSVQFTERVALLAHDDMVPRIDAVTQGNYGTTYSPGAGIELKRGWIKVDATLDGVPHHFVATHLEIQQLWPFQVGQTQELLSSVAAGLDGVVVLFGDLNSDAEAAEGEPTWTPTYGMILQDGFSDLWEMTHPGNNTQGLTCCNAADLGNPEPTFYQRNDFVLLKIAESWSNGSHFPGAVTMEIVGDDPSLRTPENGLWPSDHAGLVANIFWAPGQFAKQR